MYNLSILPKYNIMSTNSTISVVCKDGIVKSVYCHYDGYIDHTGNILKQYYNTSELAEKLVDKGDISYLQPTIKNTIFYHRDYKEPKQVKKYDSLQDYTVHYIKYGLFWTDYDYIFMNDHKWYLYFPKTKHYQVL